MTIAVAIRTSSAVIFAADSKLTTQGIVGIEEDGGLRWQTQTYDHAVKVVHDQNEALMGMVAGSANIGTVAATDFISCRAQEIGVDAADQDRNIRTLVAAMNELRATYWRTTQAEPEKWPGPTLLLSAPAPDGQNPRVWRTVFEGPEPVIEEILTTPGIRLEGAFNEVFTLLYGWHPEVISGIQRALQLTEGRMQEVLANLGVLRPIDKLSLYAMPIQDAIDLAVFLANIQVQMDRFLPGEPLCGGPIDVMVLQMAPERRIRSFPGKVIHHPLYNQRG